MKIKKQFAVISAICLVIAFILFPIVRPSGLSLRRQATITAEADGGRLIEIRAYVYRGVYFSPDGPTWARWYYEKIRLRGKGEAGSLGSRHGHYFHAGSDFACIGTKFYDSGTLFLDDAENYMSLSVSKRWGYASDASAYVNGGYNLR